MKNQLKEDLNDFLKEKEELREVIGKIGGNNNSQAKIVTTLFVGIVLVLFVAGIVLKQLSPMTTLLLLILILGFKIIWMQQQTQKSMHFQFWILNSIEIRINELDKKQKKLEKMIGELENKKELENEENGTYSHHIVVPFGKPCLQRMALSHHR